MVLGPSEGVINPIIRLIIIVIIIHIIDIILLFNSVKQTPPSPPQNKIKIKKGSEGFIETAPSGMGSVLYTKMNVFKSDFAIYQSLRPVLRDSQLLPVPETKDVFCLPYIADRNMNIFGIKAIKNIRKLKRVDGF